MTQHPGSPAPRRGPAPAFNYDPYNMPIQTPKGFATPIRRLGDTRHNRSGPTAAMPVSGTAPIIRHRQPAGSSHV